MDKRWIIIIIILIVGFSSLYFIVNDSMRLGKAIDTIDNVIITLPTDFKIGEKTPTSAELMDRDADKKIKIELIKQKNKASVLMKNKTKTLKSEGDVADVKNYTQKIANITTYSISYKNVTTETPVNYSMNFINKLNKTFIITTCDYDNDTAQLKDLTYVIDTIRLDYKIKEK
ncbi:hypothetical protein [Methanobrevibacter sp.]|jgi:hypothetical protein|uniref:hypothetical protein n=1 Tax=Methanobrevibacter sp. TaxID=66852 RepID=UPI0038696BDB